jgi:predicted Fe-Mo cluster-binding NifX family protein
VVIRPLLLFGVGVAALLPWLFSRYELRIGRAVNSPSLIADAKEFQAHVLSSGVLLAALIGQSTGWPLDRPAAILIIVWIVYVGWETLINGMRVLLDASVDADTLTQARRIIVQQPAVVEVTSLIGRNAGRYRFIETKVGLRVHALEKAHQISHEIETAIRASIPHVERVLVHIEPAQKPLHRVAVPLAERSGVISPHFGTAPYFALTDIETKTGKAAGQMIIVNPHADDPRGRGIKVAQWLLEQQVDVLVTADDVQDKGPGYALGDAGVKVMVNAAGTLADAVRVSLQPAPETAGQVCSSGSDED